MNPRCGIGCVAKIWFDLLRGFGVKRCSIMIQMLYACCVYDMCMLCYIYVACMLCICVLCLFSSEPTKLKSDYNNM